MMTLGSVLQHYFVLFRANWSDAQHHISGFIHTGVQDRNQTEANQKQDSAMLLSKIKLTAICLSRSRRGYRSVETRHISKKCISRDDMTMYVEYINCPKSSGDNHGKGNDGTGSVRQHCFVLFLAN